MRYKIEFRVLIAMLMVTLISCNSGPEAAGSSSEYQKIETTTGSDPMGPRTPSNSNGTESISSELHTVVVSEILPASRYLYLNVKEGPEEFWIAVRKQDIKIGGTYYYKRALLKTNFESKENQKVFDKIYLVTNLVSADHASSQKSMENVVPSKMESAEKKPERITDEPPGKIIDVEGSVKIADLVKNAKKYAGKTIQISGECVKINPGIMDRNWIHIKDGSQDDFDMVITSDTYVSEGTVITMKALVSLDKDFGAGYTYDLILENGVMVQ